MGWSVPERIPLNYLNNSNSLKVSGLKMRNDSAEIIIISFFVVRNFKFREYYFLLAFFYRKKIAKRKLKTGEE